MTANAASLVQSSCTSTRVHRDGLFDDESILSELPDCLAGVCGGDFGGLVRVKPNLALSAVQNVCREALLGTEVDP
jgi:hypothetical protein